MLTIKRKEIVMFNRTKSALKNAIRSWLNLTSANGLQIQIDELLDFEANAFVKIGRAHV